MAMLLEASRYKEQTHLWIAENAFGRMESLETLSAMNCQVLLSVRKGFLEPQVFCSTATAPREMPYRCASPRVLS